jgi:hypothetical protein
MLHRKYDTSTMSQEQIAKLSHKIRVWYKMLFLKKSFTIQDYKSKLANKSKSEFVNELQQIHSCTTKYLEEGRIYEAIYGPGV